MLIFGVTAWAVVIGVKHPTAKSTVAITLLCAIGVQGAYISMQTGLRLWAKPESVTLRTEAQARSRAAAALEDAETAEKIKLELNAYIAVRARRLEIDRRRLELSSGAEALNQSYDELIRAERQLGVELTQLDSETVKILDSLVEPSRQSVPDFYFYGIPIGDLFQRAVDAFGDYREKQRLRRMSHLAPEALKDETEHHDR